MFNPQEASASIKKYLLKLNKIINENVIFHLGKTKIINKAKIDDILCCVEGSFPKEYKAYMQKYGTIHLKSNVYLNQLHGAIKNKFLFSTTNYAVNAPLAENLINAIISVLDSDLNRVMEDQ